jgi:hypothetical protein
MHHAKRRAQKKISHDAESHFSTHRYKVWMGLSGASEQAGIRVGRGQAMIHHGPPQLMMMTFYAFLHRT